jgi:hypothetical protein
VSAESENYRQRAAVERDAAAKEGLSNRRALHLRSAEVWERLAQTIEETEARASVNLAVRAIEKGPVAPVDQLMDQHDDPPETNDSDHGGELADNDTNIEIQDKSTSVGSRKIKHRTVVSSPYLILHRYTLPFLHDGSQRYLPIMPKQLARMRRTRH